jgi:NAD(P)-dependent dehydrogenase (short-subunit alcohol dehydrogenase family)
MAVYDVAGKVAVVTGGGSGIGAACALTLARSGAKVAVADVQIDAARAVVSAIGDAGGEAHALEADVADPTSVVNMVQATIERFGGLHVGVNNAGIGGDHALTGDYPLDSWRSVMSVNLDGVFYCTRAEIGAMRAKGGGSIVNMASVLGAVGWPESVAYVAAKHGVVGLTKSAAIEHAADGIRVNAVGPGFINTPLIARDLDEGSIALLADLHPQGRIGEAQEVAELVAWLASDAASFATGTYYAIDGGYLAR